MLRASGLIGRSVPEDVFGEALLPDSPNPLVGGVEWFTAQV